MCVTCEGVQRVCVMFEGVQGECEDVQCDV